MKLQSALCGSGLLLFLSACNDAPFENYFPQKNGMFWQYNVTQNTNILPYNYKHLIMNLDHEKVDGQRLLARRDHLGNLLYYQVDKDGVSRFGARKEGSELERDEPGNYMIRFPLTVGTEWKIISRPYLMERRMKELNDEQNSMPALSLLDTLTMQYRIESVNDNIEVAAGRFNSCVKVRGYGTCNMGSTGSVGNFTQSVLIEVEHIDWYCPGAGLVKTERKEINQKGILQAAEYRSELELLKTEI